MILCFYRLFKYQFLIFFPLFMFSMIYNLMRKQRFSNIIKEQIKMSISADIIMSEF